MTPFDVALARISSAPEDARDKLQEYAVALRFYNRRLNLVARTDEENILERHVAHCLVLAECCFPAAATVVDWGTGGGLPLIPLAIVFPQIRFIGVDAVEKKAMAVRHMARALGLDNVEGLASRAEETRLVHSHSVSRATAPLALLWGWHLQAFRPCETGGNDWPAGLVCLKGGELRAEIEAVAQAEEVEVEQKSIALPGRYYEDKKIVTVVAA